MQGEQAACSASTLALVRRGSKQQGGEQRWGVFLQQQLKAVPSIVQAGFDLRAAQDGDS